MAASAASAVWCGVYQLTNWRGAHGLLWCCTLRLVCQVLCLNLAGQPVAVQFVVMSIAVFIIFCGYGYLQVRGPACGMPARLARLACMPYS